MLRTMTLPLLFILLASTLAGAAELPPLSVAPFRGDAEGALSLTFDDGTQKQVDVAVPLLEEYGIKATFFLIAGLVRDKKSDPPIKYWAKSPIASWEEWRSVAALGHEIANHSMTHAGLRTATDKNDPLLKKEINDAYDLIEMKMGKPPLTFCYPGNGKNDISRAVVLERHCLGRERCVGYGNQTKDFGLAMANGYADRAMAEHDWIVGMLHGVDGEAYSPVDTETLRGHLEYISSLKDRLWVDTFANVGRYRLEREQAVIAVRSRSRRAVTFKLTTPLDAKRFNYPLTVIIPTEGRARRVFSSHPARAIDGKLLVDVVPNRRIVTVQWF